EAAGPGDPPPRSQPSARDYPRWSGRQRLAQPLERVVECARVDPPLADRAGEGDCRAVTQHVDPALPAAQDSRSRDLDAGVDQLGRRELPEHLHRGQAIALADLIDAQPRGADCLIDRLELLAPDIAAVADGDLPAHDVSLCAGQDLSES